MEAGPTVDEFGRGAAPSVGRKNRRPSSSRRCQLQEGRNLVFQEALRGSVSQKRLGLRRLLQNLDQPVRDHLILAVFELPHRETEDVRIAV